MKNALRIFLIATIVLTNYLLSPKNSHGVELFYEGFEYGQTANNLSDCRDIPGFTSNWNGDSQDGDGALGITSVQSKSGDFAGTVDTGTGSSTFLEANYSFGNNYYIDMSIYPRSSSTMHNNNKLIYAYISSTGTSVWCLKVSRDRLYTGNCSWGWQAQSAGWSLHYVGPGAATHETGLNNLKVKYLIEDRWNRFVFHVNQVSNSRTDLELWIDNGDGNGLEKTGEVTVSDSECVAVGSGVAACGRLKFGLMSDAWMSYYYDDVRIVTSANDISWSGSSSEGLRITSSNLSDATVGESYSESVSAINGEPEYTWRVSSGTLPNGLLMDTNGEITGTPVAGSDGVSVITLEVQDQMGAVDTKEFSILVSDSSVNEVLIQDNFEGSDLAKWVGPWGEIGSSDPDYCYITTAEKYEGNKSLRETIPPGQSEGGKLRFSFSDNQKRSVYSQFYYKCSDPWDPLTANKIIILNAGNVPSGPTTADLQIILDIVHSQGSALGEFQVEYSNYINGSTQYHNMRQNVGTPVKREANRWYKLGLEVDAGTPGNNDGKIIMWVDDEIKCNYENLNLLPRTDYTKTPLFHWLIITNMGDTISSTRTSWYDDFFLATGKDAPVVGNIPEPPLITSVQSQQ